MDDIAKSFRTGGRILDISPLGSGHINDSYRVKTDGATDYLLQRINHHIFPDVPGLMRNIDRVTRHIRAGSRVPGPDHQGPMSLTLIPAQNGELFHQDAAGNYWRTYEFLTGLRSYDLVETTGQAFEGGRAFGHFLQTISSLPPDQITPVLPDFHNVLTRLAALRRAVDQDAAGRAKYCRPAITYAISLADEMSVLQRHWQAGRLPTRITHNDTKFNNVMLDAAGRGRCVVDLDTVMPGLVHFDVGDGIRTGAATASEDEAELHLVGFDREKYLAYVDGYLSSTSDLLTPLELELLPRSGPLLAYLMAIRFLTDYLMGDVYYKTAYPEHNLVRARNQFKLLREMLILLPV